MYGLGAGIIAISVLGKDPGYGVLALYIIHCMTLSLLAFFFRIVVLLALVGSHLIALMSFSTVRETKFGVSTLYGCGDGGRRDGIQCLNDRCEVNVGGSLDPMPR